MPAQNTKKVSQLGKRLNSLLVGDVGSGKTVVAALVSYVFLNGMDSGTVIVMAPTELLANQHFHSFQVFAQSKTQVDLFLITQSVQIMNTNKIKKSELSKKLEQSKKKILIGTQSLLFQQDVRPHIVIIDEQQRFGIKQRLHWSSFHTHFLSLSATPIPRTLALLEYGFVEPIFLESLPGKKKIDTQVVDRSSIETKVKSTVLKVIQQGKKVFVVVSKIVDEEDVEAMTLQKAVSLLSSWVGKEKVISTHGKDTLKQKQFEHFFTDPAIQVFVSTSIVEVGVDVKEATCMIVFDAHRFGLATLHQLRGRIGRNNYENNVCFFISDRQFQKRLKIFESSQDGFAIAQSDLKRRGSGQLLGYAQSGKDSILIDLYELGSSEVNRIRRIVEEQFPYISQYPRLLRYIEQTKKQYLSGD